MLLVGIFVLFIIENGRKSYIISFVDLVMSLGEITNEWLW